MDPERLELKGQREKRIKKIDREPQTRYNKKERTKKSKRDSNQR